MTTMQEEVVRALRDRRAQIRSRWEAFLRIEAVSTPLANPDTLVFGINQSLNELFTLLRQPLPPESEPEAACTCGKNPLLAYYRAGEQAMLEALVLVQVGMPSLNPVVRDLAFAELKHVINTVARREISAIAGVCQHRDETATS
ncbi:MAG: hypothetical protein Q8J74_05840 [Candidatus Didemnitutus sp.]|nr:hypothetical protein [Candidatus Didemnitutus sp.]